MADATALNMEVYRKGKGFLGQGFCGSPHPQNPPQDQEDGEFHFCRRLEGHEGRDEDGHAAFTHSISELTYWPAEQDLDHVPSL